MNENFITLFNFNYLPQGLNMFFSLKKNLPKSKLWVVCMDKKVSNFLEKKKIEDLKIIPLNNIENKKLLSIKKKRKFIEYCWTLTPFLPEYFFKIYKKQNRVTYLDADLFFFKKPNPIINEFINSKKSILITEHGFHKKYDKSTISGRFCVQYMIFKNNSKTKKVLKWWQDKCIEWCHDYPDKGRLGDQKYLDQWPKLFKNIIHVSRNKKYFQGPWTYNRFKTVDKIIYHFHGLKIASDKVLVYNRCGFTKDILNYAYLPYCISLKKILKELNFEFNQVNEKFYKIKSLLYNLRHNFLKIKINKRYIIDLKKLNEKN